MIILFCGGQRFKDTNLAYRTFRALLCREGLFTNYPRQRDTILHSTAPGAGRLSGKLAILYGLPVKQYAANWHAHGASAGSLRDQRMIEHGKPQLVVAFPGGKRTNALIRSAKNVGIPVILARKSVMT